MSDDQDWNPSAICWDCHGAHNMAHPRDEVILTGADIRKHVEQGHDVAWTDEEACGQCGCTHPRGYTGDCRDDKWRL